MTANSTTAPPTDPPTAPKPPECTRRHCDNGDCDPCDLNHIDEDHLWGLDRAMAAAWLEHWPVGHPERLTDWRRSDLQPWRTVAQYLEAANQ